MPDFSESVPILLPAPKSVKWGGGFLPWEKAEFRIDSAGLPVGDFLTIEYPGGMPAQNYEISVSESGISVRAGSEKGARLALQTLRQIGMQSDKRGFRFVEISDAPDLEVRGFMLDISRCKVPKLGELAKLVDMLALFKYNRLELYTEHTFAFEGHELVWADASPLTAAAVRKLGEICASAGIEFVPNMNGPGHMERWLRYPKYAHLAESKAPFVDPLGTVRKYPTTLYPDVNALDFMDSLYAQFLPNFESENFNIGGDEPWELGMGRSKAQCEAEGGKYGIYIRHILGLRERAAKYGKKVCFWADVLMQSPKYSEQLPEDMTPILWGYYLDHPYEQQCSYMESLGRKYIVAPGTSTWNSFGSRWDCAYENIKTACDCAKRHGAEGMILTQWGDGGNHQPWCAMYPALVLGGAASWGSCPSAETVCEALDRFVFIDGTGNFSRALCMLGRADPVMKLFCFYHKIFFATPEDAKKLSAECGYDFSAIEGAADFALALSESSSPACRDGELCKTELSLGVEMIKWAMRKARGDFSTETDSQQRDLKIIVSRYENIWLERAAVGGLCESAGRIRAIRPDIFA